VSAHAFRIHAVVAICLAENQRLNIEAMRAAGVLEYAGDVHDARSSRYSWQVWRPSPPILGGAPR